jgi:hypothetical protein
MTNKVRLEKEVIYKGKKYFIEFYEDGTLFEIGIYEIEEYENIFNLNRRYNYVGREYVHLSELLLKDISNNDYKSIVKYGLDKFYEKKQLEESLKEIKKASIKDFKEWDGVID